VGGGGGNHLPRLLVQGTLLLLVAMQVDIGDEEYDVRVVGVPLEEELEVVVREVEERPGAGTHEAVDE
jgi:hypothetical protein